MLYTADQCHHILMILTCVKRPEGGWPKTAGCSEVRKGGREGLLIENKMFNKNFFFELLSLLKNNVSDLSTQNKDGKIFNCFVVYTNR